MPQVTGKEYRLVARFVSSVDVSWAIAFDSRAKFTGLLLCFSTLSVLGGFLGGWPPAVATTETLVSHPLVLRVARLIL
eukprot:3481771-Pyramimonas_sp.AAC.1